MGADVLVVGAGPAGSIAALVLARAGVRVRVIDRVLFPRDKLCGDTVNPGTVAALRRLGVAAGLDAHGVAIRGMKVSGPTGIVIEGRYGGDTTGRALLRREFDWMLLEAAIDAGAQFEPEVRATAPIVDGPLVRGVKVRSARGDSTIDGRVVIAADGRRSTLAFGLGLASHPPAPRRWAVGGYFEQVSGLTDLGEMHVRRGHYIGVAPVPGGIANVCVVTTPAHAGGGLSDPAAFLSRIVRSDPILRDRFTSGRAVSTPVVLGPLAVDARSTGVDGVLLAGDAAGFIDPMTGDGLRFAVRGGELAAAAALEALAGGWTGVHARYAAARRAEFGTKWQINRALRRLVSAADAVTVAAYVARVAPQVVRAVIRKAGDCDRS